LKKLKKQKTKFLLKNQKKTKVIKPISIKFGKNIHNVIANMVEIGVGIKK
jgi:hypothetical protein